MSGLAVLGHVLLIFGNLRDRVLSCPDIEQIIMTSVFRDLSRYDANLNQLRLTTVTHLNAGFVLPIPRRVIYRDSCGCVRAGYMTLERSDRTRYCRL